MSRDLTSEVNAAIQSDFGWVLMLQLDLDSGSVFVHTGVGTIPWNGESWRGVGSMASISGMVETVDGGDDRITVSLSGIPIETLPDFVDEFTLEDTAGRDWFLYIAILDENGEIDGDATQLNSGQTGAAELTDGPNATVSLSLVTEAALMKAILFYRMTDEDQQGLFPGDLFCQYMNDLGNEIRWGSSDPTSLPRGGSLAPIGPKRIQA